MTPGPPTISRRLSVAVLVLALGTGAGVVTAGSGGPPAAFRPTFPATGLVTNEFAHTDPTDPRAKLSPDWIVTSGSLFARGGQGWSGRPDDADPGPDSALHTGSSVFRLISRRADFQDTAVTVRLDHLGWSASNRTPGVDWDGVHIWLRYRSEAELYVVSVLRRDGSVAIKRKLPGGPSNGGTYVELARAEAGALTGPADVRAEVVNVAEGVRLRLFVNQALVLEAVDGSPDRIDSAGAVGLRGDNAEFTFADFAAVPAEASTA